MTPVCKNHPHYCGRRKPHNDCRWCWMIWHYFHPDED